MRRVQRACILAGVHAAREVEVVVDHVVGGVRYDQPDDREEQQGPQRTVGAEVAARSPPMRPEVRVMEKTAGAGDEEPARDGVHAFIGRKVGRA